MAPTYEKRLGIVNAREKPPVVLAAGKAWCTTSNGAIAVVPDSWERFGEIGSLGPIEPLPADLTDVEEALR